ncbi:TauD/TfdA dioxygenase family protein [Siccirubricoccus phaeus]|uniref:TauD/TfdA dioxygenase family protein n=1 Tax=Siccirubricoccus phaeus TaxID=2595053 RepID=UPI0011F0E8B1|nr:TauD/TfdA family dioxygenase [Siccirubricoccus phaeus]
MALEFHPLHSGFGTEVRGLDLSGPVSEAEWEAVLRAFHTKGVVVLRGQRLDEAGHVAVSRRFGPLQIHVLTQFLTTSFPEIYVLSNASRDGHPIGNHKEGLNWHSDWSYRAEPAVGSLLYGRVCPPEGADTLFACMHLAYEALSPEMQARIEPLHAVHSYATYYGRAFADRTKLTPEQQAATPDVVHPLVRLHPGNGRRALYVGREVVKEILGLPPEESAALLEELNSHAVRPEFIYRHRWQEGDLVAWDNRNTMHQATPYDDAKYIRIMHRTTLAGERPVPAVMLPDAA